MTHSTLHYFIPTIKTRRVKGQKGLRELSFKGESGLPRSGVTHSTFRDFIPTVVGGSGLPRSGVTHNTFRDFIVTK